MAETIGHYQVIERLGAGSLGDEVRARDTRLGRTVTIKLIDGDIAGDPESREAFLADARASTALSHPSVASLFEPGEDGERLFLVFEFVPGTTLRAFMGDRPLNPKRAIDLATQVADAVADGHAQGLLHGDINPETIMITPTGRAKLLDYGLSRWTAGGRARANAAEADAAGTMLSSLAYMSPEQALGGTVDGRTDVFSLGTVLYEMLTVVSPFAQAGAESTLVQVLQRALAAPSSLNSRVAPELDALVGRTLMRSLDQREASAAALSADLKSLGADLEGRAVEALAAPVAARRSPRRSGWLLLLLLLGLAALGAWYWRDTASQLWRGLVDRAAPVGQLTPLNQRPAGRRVV